MNRTMVAVDGASDVLAAAAAATSPHHWDAATIARHDAEASMVRP